MNIKEESYPIIERNARLYKWSMIVEGKLCSATVAFNNDDKEGLEEYRSIIKDTFGVMAKRIKEESIRNPIWR